jgi:non-ribosomal peptide synthase protein (TIGR01720 family)
MSAGQAVQLPPKTTSYKAWAEKLTEYAQSDAARAELDYWLSVAQGPGATLLPGNTKDESAHSLTETIPVSLGEEETRALLHEVPAAYGTEINDVLLAALAQAFAAETGARELLVDLEGHGREELIAGVDLSRTVGWFTSLYPVRLKLPTGASLGDELKAVKEQLRRVPSRGVGFGILRWLSLDETIVKSLRELPRPEIGFNYLGQVDQAMGATTAFRLADESVGESQSPRAHRAHRIEINGSVAGGRLQFGWSCERDQRARIEQLASAYLTRLRELIAHCRQSEAGGYTPSDFPDAGLNQSELDALLAEVGSKG